MTNATDNIERDSEQIDSLNDSEPGDECQLCRLLDRRGDEINEATHTTRIAREDGGTKFVYHCRRCGEELWGYDETDPLTDRIEGRGSHA